MSLRKKVFVKSNKPLMDLGKVRSNVWEILETHQNGFVVEASQFQIEVLRNMGFEVLESVDEEEV